MSRTINYVYEDKEGTHELTVEWTVSPSRSATIEDPMDYGEIEIISVREDGVDFEIRKTEYIKIERFIEEHEDYSDLSIEY